MGASVFYHSVKAEAVADAFALAQAEARYEYGHGGYSGTIAEKPGWVVIQSTPVDSDTAHKMADSLIDAEDPRIDNKWGDAGAIAMTDGSWLFFGWASC